MRPSSIVIFVAVLCYSIIPTCAAPRSYLYYPSSDVMSTSETLYQADTTSVPALSALCDATPECVGFNANVRWVGRKFAL